MEINGTEYRKDEITNCVVLIIEEAIEMISDQGESPTDVNVIKMLAAQIFYLRIKSGVLELEKS